MASEEKLIQMTIRVPQSTKDLILKEAETRKCSSSEIIRSSIEDNLTNFNDDVEYVSQEDSQIIIEKIKDIFTQISDIKNALNAIGRNYNQKVRAMNIANKYSMHEIDLHDMLREFSFIEKEYQDISAEKLDEIMNRYESISQDLVEEIMCYTRISGTRNGKKAIAYALGNGHGHNGYQYRNLMVGTVGLLPEEFGVSYLDQMEAIWAQKLSKNNLNQIRRVIVSFSPNELSKDKEADIQLAMQMCQEFVRESYEGHDAIICLSADGKGSSNSPESKLHAHILINNVSSQDFKGCTRDQGHFSYVMREWNKVQRKYITIDLGKGAKDKISEKERHMREENEKASSEGLDAPHYIWKDDLKRRIQIAMNTATSKESFIEKLSDVGVIGKYRREGKPNEYIAYELVDIPVQYEVIRGSFKARSYTLGTDYDMEMLLKKIETNNKNKEKCSIQDNINMPDTTYVQESVNRSNSTTRNNNSDTNNSSSTSSAGGYGKTKSKGVECELKNPLEKKKPNTAYERLLLERAKMDKAYRERRMQQHDYEYGEDF